MCGILAALGMTGDPETNRRLLLRCSKLLRHRGPDANSIYQSKDGKNFLAFERLQIIDPSDGGRYVLLAALITALLPPATPDIRIQRERLRLLRKSTNGLRTSWRRQPFAIQTPNGDIAWQL